jgi:hypothetical protein
MQDLESELNMLFRELSTEEEKSFRQWARDNYKPFDPIEGIWHSVIQSECVKMNEEAGAVFDPEVALKDMLEGAG